MHTHFELCLPQAIQIVNSHYCARFASVTILAQKASDFVEARDPEEQILIPTQQLASEAAYIKISFNHK